MINTKALRGKMYMESCSVERLAKEIGMSRASLYRRLQGEKEFTISEMQRITRYLNIPHDEKENIFFNSDCFLKETFAGC